VSRPAVGVDLGGTKIHTVVATPTGDVLGEERVPTLAVDGPAAVLERLTGSIRTALERAGLTSNEIGGIGISSPGPCDPFRGIVTNAPNLPGWIDVPIVEIVRERMGVPVLLENDANAAAFGELRYGAGRGFKHLLYVTLGTGIGGGIIIDGKIYEGASGAAGEVGHITLVEDGPLCNCGSRGCLEALASGPAMARDAAQAIASGADTTMRETASGSTITTEHVLQAAQRGDEVAEKIIRRAGEYLGRGLVGLLNVFDPECLILGGGLLALGDLYIGTAIRMAKERAFAQIVADVTITTAALDTRAGALGAAALVMANTSE
jgi:glucokinase